MKTRKILPRTIIAFSAALTVCLFLSGIVIVNRVQVESLTMELKRIPAVRAWYEFPETWIALTVSIFISLLLALVVQNFQDLKRLKDKLEKLSNTDHLTGLSNRRHFLEIVSTQINRVLRHNSESFIMILDLDHFKEVNDSYGHQAGDLVLKEVAKRILATLRSYDLLARYGGEEFLIFAAELDSKFAVELAERIRTNIAKTPIKVDEMSLTITASLGLAKAAPVNKLEEAISLADQALYRAKSEGRNKTVYISTNYLS